MNRRAFTLLEMLLAIVLSAMLMAAVLVVLGGVARDRQMFRSMNNETGHDVLLAQLRWDLTNAGTMSVSEDGITLVGSGALDQRTLAPTGRLVEVTYRKIVTTSGSALVRSQQSLDDPAQPQHWQETIAWNVNELSISADGADVTLNAPPMSVPPRVRLRLDIGGNAVDQELWLK
jgi:prepilin-type N-terminal cleavage/methylation domain-containing protein